MASDARPPAPREPAMASTKRGPTGPRQRWDVWLTPTRRDSAGGVPSLATKSWLGGAGARGPGAPKRIGGATAVGREAPGRPDAHPLLHPAPPRSGCP